MARHSINTDLIDTHWDDMIRVAASLKTGDVTASLIVTRLQAGARRNQLTKSIQELGRAAKTRFLLNYLEDETYRRRIGRQLNKGETLHALRQFIFFANGAQIRHRRPEDQTNQAICLNLVTNAVIVWNTVYVHAAIEHLRSEGFITDHDDLSIAHSANAHQPIRPLHLRNRTRPQHPQTPTHHRTPVRRLALDFAPLILRPVCMISATTSHYNPMLDEAAGTERSLATADLKCQTEAGFNELMEEIRREYEAAFLGENADRLADLVVDG